MLDKCPVCDVELPEAMIAQLSHFRKHVKEGRLSHEHRARILHEYTNTVARVYYFYYTDKSGCIEVESDQYWKQRKPLTALKRKLLCTRLRHEVFRYSFGKKYTDIMDSAEISDDPLATRAWQECWQSCHEAPDIQTAAYFLHDTLTGEDFKEIRETLNHIIDPGYRYIIPE